MERRRWFRRSDDGSVLRNASEQQKPRLLNLRYDLTPVKYVSLVVTEVGIIPPTSVSGVISTNDRIINGSLVVVIIHFL